MEEGGEGEKEKSEKEKKQVSKKGTEEKTEKFLITGASKAMVQKYVTAFKLAGLDLVSLETETFAIIRSLIGKDKSRTMIVDLGAVRTNIIIVENGIPYVTRSLDMGGHSFTEAMSKTLSMNMMDAEKMKTDIKTVSSLYPNDTLPKLFENAVAPMITELQYSMNLYVNQGGSDEEPKTIEKIILTGGASALPSLATYIAEKLNTKTYVGDPWARVVYPDALRPVLDELGPRFAVGIGLAMRDIE